jgi:hypothetical protein
MYIRFGRGDVSWKLAFWGGQGGDMRIRQGEKLMLYV